MKIVVTGGGTGGHVYPALSIIEALSGAIDSGDEGVLFIGSKRGMEGEIVRRAGLRFAGIQAGPLRGRSPVETAMNVVRLGIGLIESLRLIGQHRPKIILATGGYVCAPVVVAGWLRGIPSAIYLPDVRPGWAIRTLSRLAKVIATTSEKSAPFLPRGKVVHTGYPVRPEILQVDKARAREQLGLTSDLPVLLVFGGSRGAHSINLAIRNGLDELLAFCQLVHVSGNEDEPQLRKAREALSGELRQRYHLYPYLHEEFPSALVAADLAVSRSGASVMGEYPAAGLPSILVPYPFAGAHQRLNARVLADAGAAIVLENEQLGQLASLARELLQDKGRLAKMAAQARRMARPEAAAHLARVLVEIGSTGRMAS